MTNRIDVEKVVSVYSGRPGCMCGCRGKHTYASKTREAAGKDRGYEVCDEEVSDRSVKMIVNKMNKMIDWDAESETYLQEGFRGEQIFFFDTDTRSYVAYVKP